MPAGSDGPELPGPSRVSPVRPVGLADSAFAGDDGTCQPGVREALRVGLSIEQLATIRLLVPITAEGTEGPHDSVGSDGSDGREGTSQMAVVWMVNASGARGLLAFTGLDTLQSWDPIARPVPVLACQAALAAVQDGADALVIDVLGPHRLAVEGEDLIRLAALANSGR